MGRYEEALKCLNQSVLIEPMSAVAWEERGWALNELDFYSRAIDNANLALLIDSQFSDAWSVKGYALESMGLSADAETAYANARAARGEISKAKEATGDVIGARTRI
jgi:tetratricopeptide (TPR) repeat protein